MSSLLSFFFFSLKIRRKIFPKYTEGGELECSDLVFEGNEITVVGQREQPGGKLDHFVAGECKFLHLISCTFLYVFFILLSCSFSFFSIDTFLTKISQTFFFPPS